MKFPLTRLEAWIGIWACIVLIDTSILLNSLRWQMWWSSIGIIFILYWMFIAKKEMGR